MNMNDQKGIHDLMVREFATTLKVVRAYPNAEHAFKPHERSNSAFNLVRTFVAEEMFMLGALDGEIKPETFSAYKPELFEQMISDFEKTSNEVLEKYEHATEEQLNKTVSFGPMQMPARDLIFMMLLDQIHHRGQLSVYVRMAGGLVPSIYGPSADDDGGFKETK
jgi:uncharacterized damage-inducible protein DinB